MINIKILIFIIILILLCVIYFFYNRAERFSTQNCKEFSNVNLVFHKLDFEPEIGGKKLYNYVNEDFLDKFIVNNMNSIFRPAKIRFNNVKLIEENMTENLRSHYDNFKKNYKSYGRRRNPKNEDYAAQGDGSDYSALLQKIRSHKLTNYPLPIRRVRQQSQDFNLAGLFDLSSDELGVELPSNENENVESSDVNDETLQGLSAAFGPDPNAEDATVTEQSIALDTLARISENEDTSYLLDVNEMNDRAYDRMPRIQRFLIDKGCSDAYNALSANNQYTLEMLIQEGQGLYTNTTEVSVRTSRFNNFFDRLGIPSEPDALRVTLREAIINYDSSVVYEPAILDNAALLYTDWNFEGEQIILTEGEYKFNQINNILSRGYKRTLQDDKDREWLIDIGSSGSNPKYVATFSPWLRNPYNSSEFFISANLEIGNEPQNTQGSNSGDQFLVKINGYGLKVYRTDFSPGWRVVFKKYSSGVFSSINQDLRYGMPPWWIKYRHYNKVVKQLPNLSNLNNNVLSSLGYNDLFTIDAITMFTPTTTGDYTFYLSSDDGSRLFIYDTKTERRWSYLINNEGMHGVITKNATIRMEKDTMYYIYVDMFENYGGAHLDLKYSGPGFSVPKSFDEGKFFSSGWGQPLQLKVKYIDGNIPPINSLKVPEQYILELYLEDNLEGTFYSVPPGKYYAPYKNALRFKSYNLRPMVDGDENIVNNNPLLRSDDGRGHNNSDVMPNPSDLQQVNDIYESDIVFPSLPTENVSFDILKSTDNYYFTNYGMRCKRGEEVPKNECQKAVLELSEENNKKSEENNNLEFNQGTLMGIFTIQHAVNNRYLQAYGQDKNYKAVTQPNSNNENQKWVIRHIYQEFYSIQEKSTTRFLEASVTGDMEVKTNTMQNNDSQRWIIKHNNNNIYTIQHAPNVKYLNAYQDAKRDYRVINKNESNNNSQNWILNKVGDIDQCDSVDWGLVPQGCSSNTGDDWTAHYRELENKDSCVDDDKFRRVCRRIENATPDNLLEDDTIVEILVNGPDKICSEMLDKFAETDLKIIKNTLNRTLSEQNTDVLFNLFINSINRNEYNDNNLHIYFVPFLPNDKKYYVVKGKNNKPLILMSLYNTRNYTKNIQSYDTTTVCKNFLADYFVDKKQLIKFQNEYDKLMNGEKERIARLKKLYEEKLKTIESIKGKYPNLDEIIKKYNCAQRQLIEIYSKDYMKTTELIKLKRLKHKRNYKNLVDDKIKELKAIDQKKINTLIKESMQYKKIIDESNSKVKLLVNDVENLKNQLIALYSGKVDQKLKERYKKSIAILRGKISKLDYLMKKLGPPIMLSKIFSILNGLDGCIPQNESFDILKSIQENGINLSNEVKDLMFNNSSNYKYLDFENKPSHNFIENAPFLNEKCSLIDIKMPENLGFSKDDYAIESSKIQVNKSNKLKNNEAIFTKDENNILSYSGYISKKNNNNLEFNYNTKTEIEKHNSLYSGDATNKGNCLLGANYYYDNTPKLELNDKIIILREILENRQEYTYLNKNDLKYLENLLLFLEREFFDKNYKLSKSEDLSNNKIDEKYFRDNIFTKEEALNILESVIIEAYRRKGSFNINSKLSNVYSQNYYSGRDYYKDSEERNKLSPTNRVYKPPKEAIPCPLKPQEQFIKEDNRTLDDYMMNPLDCVDKNYMDEFKNSFI